MFGAPGALVALLDSLSGTEILVVLVVALIVLGPEKLPGVARQIGEWAAKLRSLTQNLQTEMRDVLDDPMMKPIKDLGEFAAQPRRKITELAMAAEAEAQAEAAAAREAAAIAAADQSAGEAGDPDDGTPSDAEVAEVAEVEVGVEPPIDVEVDVEVEPPTDVEVEALPVAPTSTEPAPAASGTGEHPPAEPTPTDGPIPLSDVR